MMAASIGKKCKCNYGDYNIQTNRAYISGSEILVGIFVKDAIKWIIHSVRKHNFSENKLYLHP